MHCTILVSQCEGGLVFRRMHLDPLALADLLCGLAKRQIGRRETSSSTGFL